MTLFILSILAFLFIMLIRNMLVFKFTGHASKFIFSQSNWSQLLKVYKPSANYDKNMLSLHKWTYKSMFRKLWELENNAKSKN